MIVLRHSKYVYDILSHTIDTQEVSNWLLQSFMMIDSIELLLVSHSCIAASPPGRFGKGSVIVLGCGRDLALNGSGRDFIRLRTMHTVRDHEIFARQHIHHIALECRIRHLQSAIGVLRAIVDEHDRTAFLQQDKTWVITQ